MQQKNITIAFVLALLGPTLVFALALLFDPLSGFMSVRPGAGFVSLVLAFLSCWMLIMPLLIWFACVIIAPSLARGSNNALP